jgi:hypothetical protein
MRKHKHCHIIDCYARISKVDFSEVDNRPLTLNFDDD